MIVRAGGDSETVVKDLGATPAEILRQLTPLMQRYRVVGGASWPAFALAGGGRVLVSVEAGPERRIGGLTLPSSRVTLRFYGARQHEQARFVADFSRVTQRGGG